MLEVMDGRRRRAVTSVLRRDDRLRTCRCPHPPAPRSHEHLDYYLDEFTFRFINPRTSRSRGKLFLRLVQQAVAVQPVPHKSMVKCAGDRA